MNLKDTSINTSESNDEQKQINKYFDKKKIVFGSIIVTILLIVIITVSNNFRINMIRKDFEDFCIAYNEIVGEYNDYAMNFSSLCDFASNGSDEKLDKYVSSISFYDENFESFYETGANQELLNDELATITERKVELENAYNEYCLELYNGSIQEYNELTEKYNMLLERLAIYEIPNMPGCVTEKAMITQDAVSYTHLTLPTMAVV